MNQYQLTHEGFVIRDGSALVHRLAPEYVDWLALGNTPEAAESPPAYDPVTQTLVAQGPRLVEGVLRETWTVEAKPVPAAVTMRQGRLALLVAGKLALVQPAIDALPEPQRSAAQIEWDFSNDLQRDNAFVASLGGALCLTALQIDALFLQAASIAP